MDDSQHRPDDPSRRTSEIINREVERLEDLLKVHLDGIKDKLKVVEEQRVEQKQDTKEKVDAALAAQEKAIMKAETATTKQIDQLANMFAAERAADRETLGAIKDRVTTIEQQKAGGKALLATTSAVIGLVLALALIYGIVSALP